jgi:hypothetical protein
VISDCADDPLPAVLEILLHWCAQHEPRVFIDAAFANCKLYQEALKSKTAVVLAAKIVKTVLPDQQQMEKVLLYLHKHCQILETLDLTGTISRNDPEPGWSTYNVFLPQLPYDKLQKLHTLILTNMRLQVLPGKGFQGVLGFAARSLTRLQISSCKVMEGLNDLEAALAHLPNLQHLIMEQNYVGGTERSLPLPIVAIGTLHHLTHLELKGNKLQDAEGMRHLQGLKYLEHLELCGLQLNIRASHLSGMQCLKYLKVADNNDPDPNNNFCGSGTFEPAALAGKLQLQHVQLSHISIAGGSAVAGNPAGLVGLLPHLPQHLLQTKTLTFDKLTLSTSRSVALQASIERETVGICAKVSPQQVFTIAKQLPNLCVLDVNTDGRAPKDGISCLVSCCPGLQSLVTPLFMYSAEVLAQLSELSSLTKLSLHPDSHAAWDTVCQMTQLRHLRVRVPQHKKGVSVSAIELLQQLTQLQQLTRLDFCAGDASCCLTAVSFQVTCSAVAAAAIQTACLGNMRMDDVMSSCHMRVELRPQQSYCNKGHVEDNRLEHFLLFCQRFTDVLM